MFALDSLKIGAFRGLRDVDLGPNDSGKTSILEAVSIFCRPRDLRSWLNATWRREAMLNPEDPFFLAMEWMFPHLKLGNGPVECQEIGISGSGKFLVRDIHATYEAKTRIGTRVSSQRTEEPYEQPGARIEVKAHFDGRLESLDKVFNLWEGEPSPVGGFSAWEAPLVQTVTPVSHRVEATQMVELSAAAQKGLTNGILEMLRSLDPEIRDVRILTPRERPVLYLDYGSSGLIPLSSLGDGVRRAFLIALALNSVSGGILMIDEIEFSLHVSALETLFSWLVRACEEFDVQLFATTHSLEAIDAMLYAERENLSRIVAYRLETLGKSVEAQRLDGQLLWRMREERGFDVRL
jgi:hypothetical protein